MVDHKCIRKNELGNPNCCSCCFWTISMPNPDLARFIPQNIVSVYRKDNFRPFIQAIVKITRELWDQGMREYCETSGR